MKKTKRVLSLILVITMILSSVSVAFGDVTIDIIPLRVKEWAQSPGTNITIFTDSAGTFEVVDIDTTNISNDMLSFDPSTGIVSTDNVGEDTLRSYVTYNNGVTWVTANPGEHSSIILYNKDFDIVYSDNNVFSADASNILYDSVTDNMIPFQSPADLYYYNLNLNGVAEEGYTVASWNVYQGIVTANKVTRYNTQDEVDLATNNIHMAQEDLVLKANLTEYNIVLAAALEGDYTTESWATYQTVVNMNMVTLSNTQKEVDDATDNIRGAQDSLIAVANFDEYYSTLALTGTSDIYTEESWGQYQAVLSGITITINSSQAEVDSAVDTILAAQADLVLKPAEVYLSSYYSALESVLSEEHYTPYSWGNYQAVVNANVVNESNTQEEIDMATINIVTAQLFLEPMADFTAYDTLLIQVDEWACTNASWATYQGIVNSFDITLNSSQSEVDAAVIAIASAQANLALKANLASYSITLGNVVESNYTPQSWSEYWAVVISYEVSTESTQEEVDAAELSILAAQANLVPMADDTEYDEVIASVIESNYTVESWQAYQARLAELNVTVNLSQYELDGIVDEILMAQSSLLVLKPAEADLTAYTAALLNVVEADYTPSSWETYASVVSGNMVTVSNTQEEVDVATQNIIEAQSNLVFHNKQYLDSTKFMFSELIETDYTSDSWALVVDSSQLDESTNASMGVKYNQMMYLMSILIKLPGDLTEYEMALSNVSPENYTVESWAIYQGIVGNPSNIMMPFNLQSEINAATERIIEAQSDLVQITIVDKTELNTWKDAVANYVQADYTVDSWDALIGILNAPESTVEEVAYKVTNLQARINELVFANQPALDNVMAERELYLGFSFMFTYGSFNVLLETGDLPESTNEQVGIKVQAVTNALLGLVELSSLANLNAYNTALANVDEMNYTEQSWNEYMLVVSNNVVTADNTQKQIDDATANILEAQVTILVLKPTIADLSEYYMLLDLVVESDYTVDSWEVYCDVIRELGINENSTQEEVDNAEIIVYEAQNNMIPVDFLNMYNKFTHIQNRGYTQESWSIYLDEIENNKLNENFTRAEIELALDNLTNRVMMLRTLFNKANYDFIVNYAKTHRSEFDEADMIIFDGLLEENQIPVDSTPIQINEVVATLGREFSNFNRLDSKANTLGYDLLESMTKEEMFTTDSWTEYIVELESYGPIDELSGKEYDNVLRHIVFLQKFLVERGNLTVYSTLLNSVRQSDYTELSWAIYQSVVNDNVVGNNSSREQVNSAIVNIRNAQFNLVTKPIVIGGGSSGGISTPPTPPAPPVPPPAPPINTGTITITVRGNDVILPVRDTMTLRDNISGYINGYTDSTFRPDKSITRAETSQILSNIFKESGMLKPEVTDINGQWYSQSVEQVLSLGLMQGYNDKTFKPEKNLTRQEFAVTLVNMLDLSKMPAVGDKTFTDVDSSYGKDSIKLLASLGILQGYDDGTFRPDTEITRAEVVVIINRLLGDRITPQGIPGNASIDFMDLEDCWAREEILRALKK